MHGCSRMTIDLCISAMPGRSTSGFHRPGRHLLATKSAKRREVFGEWHEGVSCLAPTKNHLWGGLSCVWMTASNQLIDSFSGVATSRDSNGEGMYDRGGHNIRTRCTSSVSLVFRYTTTAIPYRTVCVTPPWGGFPSSIARQPRGCQ